MEVAKDPIWEKFLEGLHGFTDDFLSNGREPEILSEREPLDLDYIR